MEFVILIAGLFVLVRVLAWTYVRALLSSGWYTIQGTVELGNVEEHEIRFISYYIARIDYSYSVSNEYYSGYFERTFLREGSADTFVTRMKGQMVVVRSHPQRPDRSAVLKQDQPGGWPA
ncbi:MAG TPA: DUF3592 domain-containing protein [Candidatus Solibacter sp.]|nr:DUF3592 domain-containing protein [Candidatus Solibacter sp.]